MRKRKIDTLPVPKRKVAAKVLYQEGYTPAMIEEMLDISTTTAWRYSKLQTPEELQEFESSFRKLVEGTKKHIIIKGQKRLSELVGKEKKISEVVRALEYAEGTKSDQPDGLKRRIVAEEFFND